MLLHFSILYQERVLQLVQMICAFLSDSLVAVIPYTVLMQTPFLFRPRRFGSLMGGSSIYVCALLAIQLVTAFQFKQTCQALPIFCMGRL